MLDNNFFKPFTYLSYQFDIMNKYSLETKTKLKYSSDYADLV